MSCQKSSNGFFKAFLRRFLKDVRGQVAVIFAVSLPVLFGSGAIAVDVGHIFVARNVLQNAVDAGSRAGAVVMANGGQEAEAVTAATNSVNLNFASYRDLAGATSTVTFPTVDSVRVTVNHNLPLYLAPVIGVDLAAVNASATAQFFPVSSVPPYSMAPLAIYCNSQNGCAGAASVGQTMTVRRYCGNYFKNGPAGNACGSTIGNNEVFSVGITFDNSNSNNQFRSDVRDGYAGKVWLNQQARALPGNRSGWRDGMFDRLARTGGNEVIIPVIREASNPTGKYNIEVAEFIKVRISDFTVNGNSDQTSFEIIQTSVSTTDFAVENQGLGINSIVGVRLVE